ncbi:MAG: peptide chain release factor-like protein [Planctomycetota bacterium]
MSRSDVHPAALRPEQLLAECRVERLRRSGPGGQHRNKVETAVRLRHQPTGVGAEASERRSQAENRRIALGRLRISLAIEVRRPCAADEGPSPLWRSRLGGTRIAIGPSHEDFPTILAEVLDRIAAREGDVRRASEELGCTASQLVRLLKKEPRAIALVNRWRRDRGLAPLR